MSAARILRKGQPCLRACCALSLPRAERLWNLLAGRHPPSPAPPPCLLPSVRPRVVFTDTRPGAGCAPTIWWFLAQKVVFTERAGSVGLGPWVRVSVLIHTHFTERNFSST